MCVSLGLKKPGDFTMSEGHGYPIVQYKRPPPSIWRRMNQVSVVHGIFGFSWFAEGTKCVSGSLYLWVLMILNVLSAHEVSVKKYIMIIRQQRPLRIGLATNRSWNFAKKYIMIIRQLWPMLRIGLATNGSWNFCTWKHKTSNSPSLLQLLSLLLILLVL